MTESHQCQHGVFDPVPRPWPDGADLGDRTRILLARYENDLRFADPADPDDSESAIGGRYAHWFADLLDEWQEERAVAHLETVAP